jgi:acetyl-CoA acetyltransferase
MPSMLKDRTAVAGIGETSFGKLLPASEERLACEAILAALNDAGISPRDVDGLCSYTIENTDATEVARNIGAGDITFFSQVGYGGGAGCATVGHAAMAVAAGQANVVVAWRSRKRSARSARLWASGADSVAAAGRWTRPWGLLRPADEIAMLARRYMHEYGATRESLAEVALALRAHANRNPRAAMYSRPLNRDDYMSARWVSEPLCLYDCCLESDGALAAVVVSSERARDCRHQPVYIHAFAQGMPRQVFGMTNYFCEEPLRTASFVCGQALWRDADFAPADVKVAQIYDAFSPLILFALEGFGLCGRGEAKDFVRGGRLCWDAGAVAVNTAGGSLSEAYVHGFNLITEGVRQVRGTSTSQVEGAESCLVASAECVPSGALLLRR